MTLPVYSLTPFTLLDFPGRTACIIWFSGCNLRCKYCHNPQIVRGKSGALSIGEINDFLRRRQGLLDGVVLSGGESTAYAGIVDFSQAVRRMGFAVKLDTNGLRPDIIENLLNRQAVDFIALDYKAPPEKFRRITGMEKYKMFSRTLDLLCGQSEVPFEIRTTVHTALLDENDIVSIIDDLDDRNYHGNYHVQNFRADNERPTLGHLPLQARLLDIEKLPRPEKFQMQFRNF